MCVSVCMSVSCVKVCVCVSVSCVEVCVCACMCRVWKCVCECVVCEVECAVYYSELVGNSKQITQAAIQRTFLARVLLSVDLMALPARANVVVSVAPVCIIL